jgi:7-cyano-7-deazaguanine synthase
MSSRKKAVCLVSGGLDSATALAIAAQDFDVYALSIDYGQRHRIELAAAERVAASVGASDHKCVRVDLRALGGSALTDDAIAVPETATEGIPVTYVPARNSVFLAIALGWAEVLEAHDIFVGVNAVDYSGYPDCRPAFIEAFEALAKVATKAGVEGEEIHIHAPLIELSKADIIRRGLTLGVDYSLTVSCYQPDDEGLACGRCDSCRLRRSGFEAAGVADCTRYAPAAP